MPKDNRTRNILIGVGVVIALCICCAVASVAWFYLAPASAM